MNNISSNMNFNNNEQEDEEELFSTRNLQAEVTFNYSPSPTSTNSEVPAIPTTTMRRSFYSPIINNVNTNRRVLSPLRTTRRNRYTTSNTTPATLFELIGEEFLNSLESVPIIPTREQVDYATHQTRFGDISEPANNRCTISLVPFNEDSQVTQIIHCGHIFNTDEINRWFLTSCRCPICRYDIRNYSNV